MDRLLLKQEIQAMPAVWKGIRCSILLPIRWYFRYFPVDRGKRTAWRHLHRHVHWLESGVIAKTVSGSRLYLNPEDDIGRSIYYFGVWEPNLTAWIADSLSPGDIFVDVGANIGYFSILAAGIVKENGSVISIEAMPRTRQVLEGNFRLNGIRNGRIVGLGVWDAAGSLEMFGTQERASATATAFKSWAEKWNHPDRVVVPCAPLSSILTTEETRRARIVKIDVEGAEWRVISGMIDLLNNGRSDLEIVVEVNPDALRQESRSCQDLWALFRKYGFHPYEIENRYGDLSDVCLAPPTRPRRIQQIPETGQSDVIFSRRDDAVL